MELYIPVILGTAREGRQSEKAARFVFAEVKKAGIETELIDVRDYRISATDKMPGNAMVKKFEQKVNRANALIIVSPEYNHSYPGELKMLLDMLYTQYARKPVGLCGVSNGPFGGVRALEHLKLLCVTVNLVPMNTALSFPNVQDLFDASGKPTDPKLVERAQKFIEELKGYASRKG